MTQEQRELAMTCYPLACRLSREMSPPQFKRRNGKELGLAPTRSFDEKLSDALFVLCQAAKQFDATRNTKFITYAHTAITRKLYDNPIDAQRRGRTFTFFGAAARLEMKKEGPAAPGQEYVEPSQHEAILAKAGAYEPYLRMYYVENKTYDEMAIHYGVTKSAIEQTMYSARQLLKMEMEGKTGSCPPRGFATRLSICTRLEMSTAERKRLKQAIVAGELPYWKDPRTEASKWLRLEDVVKWREKQLAGKEGEACSTS